MNIKKQITLDLTTFPEPILNSW